MKGDYAQQSQHISLKIGEIRNHRRQELSNMWKLGVLHPLQASKAQENQNQKLDKKNTFVKIYEEGTFDQGLTEKAEQRERLSPLKKYTSLNLQAKEVQNQMLSQQTVILNQPHTDRPGKYQSLNSTRERSTLRTNDKQQSPFTTPRINQKPTSESSNFRDYIKLATASGDCLSTRKTDPRIPPQFSTKLEEAESITVKYDKPSTGRQSQPIFKNELTKIKTQLFQKQAQLFELSQILQQKQGIIQHLSKELASKSTKQYSQQISCFNQNNLLLEIDAKKQLEEAIYLRKELKRTTQFYQHQKEELQTSIKMMELKLRQYEMENKEQSKLIQELKQKERKIADHYDRFINGQKELIKQKQNQLQEVHQQKQIYKKKWQSNCPEQSPSNSILSGDGCSKREVISELSGEISYLKEHLNELQSRMRQMIDIQQELRKEIDSKKEQLIKNTEKINEKDAKLQFLQKKLAEKQALIEDLIRKNKNLSKNIEQISQQLKKSQQVAQQVKDAYEFQLTMIEKICEQQKKKILQYHKYSEETRIQLQIVQKKEKIECSSRKNSFSAREASLQSKDIQKLKSVNTRLIKQIEHLNSIILGLNHSVDKLSKLNISLNEQIIAGHLNLLNQQYLSKTRLEC